jgi:inhibitor of cysteine peptidase
LTEIKLTKNDNGKTVETQIGKSVVIELPENPTTGYVWVLDVKEGTDVVHLSSSRYTEVNNSGIGGGGMRTFVVNIQSSGTAKIEMKLRRQWEPKDVAIDQFKIVIKSQ